MSESTLTALEGEFDVEPGNGGERDSYLKENKVKTYLIMEKVCVCDSNICGVEMTLDLYQCVFMPII